jgi:hypothetical protein
MKTINENIHYDSDYYYFLYSIRHQVVPVKRDSDSSGSKRKASSTNISKYDFI